MTASQTVRIYLSDAAASIHDVRRNILLVEGVNVKVSALVRNPSAHHCLIAVELSNGRCLEQPHEKQVRRPSWTSCFFILLPTAHVRRPSPIPFRSAAQTIAPDRRASSIEPHTTRCLPRSGTNDECLSRRRAHHPPLSYSATFPGTAIFTLLLSAPATRGRPRQTRTPPLAPAATPPTLPSSPPPGALQMATVAAPRRR